MENPEACLANVRALRKLGVTVAIDDFGTGLSSLSHLKYLLPVDVLKVDRSFMEGLGRDPVGSAIVATMLVLATTLGVTAVAEGVESQDQVAVLRSLGCDLAQGFYFARPLPAGAINESLATRLPEAA